MPSLLKIVAVNIGIFIVKLFVYTYEILTWPIYSIFRRHIQYMPLTDPKIEEDYTYDPEEKRTLAMSTRQGDPSAPWRAVEAMDSLLTQPAPNLATAVDIWLRSVKLHPNSNAFGTREILATELEAGPGGRSFVKLTLGEYFWETFAGAELRVSRLAAGLNSLLADASHEKAPIAIFAETRAEWFYSSQAIFRLGCPLVTLYATLGDSALVHGLNETEVTTLFISDDLMSKVPYVVKNCPKLKLVIFMSHGIFYYLNNDKNSDSRLSQAAQKDLNKARASLNNGIKLMDIIDIEEMGKNIMATKKSDPGPGLWMPADESMLPKPDDLAVIMYTSGSTGMPKGVELTHRCMSSAMAGFVKRLPKLKPDKDIFIAYLPLAHVLELACELVCVYVGMRIGYGNPQTLTDNSTRIKVGACKGDVTKLRPTIMATVPTVLQRIEKTVWEKITEDGLLAKRLFKFAYDYKLRRLRAGYPSFIVDKLVFRKVRKILGGRIRYLMSAGAPLSQSSQMFAYVCFAPIIQGLVRACSPATWFIEE
ncbi:Long-chain-fatty-acid--CoA ligase 4 [Cichlidogyrus casuarinus]|uniref:long-chain-fatty-acid--CoA ligase n=1 Tax=Cichlidogyrus casuarinus TaxID=1844966 RepID=A0ABD2PVZ8_9PLAT